MSNLSSLANWPPANGPTTVSIGRNESVITLNGSISIDAPAASVWPILRNITYYPDEFDFVLAANLTSTPGNSSSDDATLLSNGTTYNLTIASSANQTTVLPQLVVDYSTPDNQSSRVARLVGNDPTFYGNLSNLYRIAWVTDTRIAGPSFRSERYTDIIITGENTSLIRSWELEAGPAAQANLPNAADLQDGFQLFFDVIKSIAENTLETTFDDYGDDTGDSGDEDDLSDTSDSSNSTMISPSSNSTNASGGGSRGGNSANVVPDANGFSGP